MEVITQSVLLRCGTDPGHVAAEESADDAASSSSDLIVFDAADEEAEEAEEEGGSGAAANPRAVSLKRITSSRRLALSTSNTLRGLHSRPAATAAAISTACSKFSPAQKKDVFVNSEVASF